MDKITCAIDTSAALSLGSTGRFKLAAKFFSFISSARVRAELIDVSKNMDEVGEIAQSILKSKVIKFTTLESCHQSEEGEIEVANLANTLNANLVLMDDAKARKKLQKDCKAQIRFSPFAIFVLYEKKTLTRKDALSAIESMKRKRNWKENLILEYAKLLFEKAEKG